jgi:Zn-dependent metalloprotease
MRLFALLALLTVAAPAAASSPEAAVLGHERTLNWRGRDLVHQIQLHRGVPVYGSAVVTHSGHEGAPFVHRVHAELTVDTTPAVDAATAATRAGDAIGDPDAVVSTPELWVLPSADGGRLVYRVHVMQTWRSWRVVIDAHSGAVIQRADLRRSAQGWVYEKSPANSDLIDVELTDLTGDQTTMNGTYARVRSAVDEGDQVEHLAQADEGGDFYFEPEDPAVEDPFAEVHTYYHLTELSHFFEDVHGHPMVGGANVTVNYHDSSGVYDNAYYSDDGDGTATLVFGQGTMFDFAYDSDVVAHEFGHFVIQTRTEMLMDFITYDEFGWNNAPGSIHEGLADYWAGSYQGDPVVGEYTISRTMDNDLTCPADLDGEVHRDGEIVGAAAWDVYEIVGKDAADALIYGALGLVSNMPTYAELAEAVVLLSADLVADGTITEEDAQAIEAALDERGMLMCGRWLPLTDGEPFEFHLAHVMGFPELPDDLCELARMMEASFTASQQFALTTPAEGTVEQIDLLLELERYGGGDFSSDDLEYSVHVRKDEMVTFDYELIDTGMGISLQIPSVRDADGTFDGEPETITVSAEDGFVLEPDSTYYFAIHHMNCPSIDITFTPTITMADPPADDDDDDVGDDDDDDEGDGCSCTLAGSAIEAGPALALLLLPWLLRRRTRL